MAIFRSLQRISLILSSKNEGRNFVIIFRGEKTIKNGDELLRKGLSLFISFLINGLLLYVAFSTKFAYKVFSLGPKSTEMTLLPALPPDVKASLIPAKKLPIKPGAKPAPPGQEAGKTAKPSGPQEAAGTSAQGRKSLAPPPGIPSGQPGQARPAFEPAFPELSSRFDLVPPSETKVNITPYSKLKEQKFIEAGKYRALKGVPDIDLAKYPFWGIPGISGGKAGTGGKVTGMVGAGQRGTATFNIQGYDISPWATEAINRIQKNWAIPSLQATNPAGKVGISVVIETSGEISQIEIILSSMDQWLDQAAYDALRLSAPFAKLPADFPKKNLEAYFLFEYGQ